MTKTHEVIEIDGGYVVVDKEANVDGGDWFYRTSGSDSWVNGLQQAKKGEFVDGYPKIIASIGIKIEGVPLIEEVEQRYSKKEVLKACELAGIRAGNANNYSEHYMKKEVLPYLKSLQKVPISVELEYDIYDDPNWVKDDSKRLTPPILEKLKVNPDNTITPIKINYD